MVVLGIQNATFAETALTGEEQSLWTIQYNELFYPPWSYERRFIDSRKSVVEAGIRAAKNALDERKFGGLNCADSEIGITPIRPGQVGLVNGATPEANNVWKWKHDCIKEAQGVGFENWIHSPAAPTTAFATPEEAFYIPLYIVEENCSPRIQTVKLDIGRANILYYDVCACRMRDYQSGTNLIPLPTTFWAPEMDVLVALGFKMNGTTEPRLGGFCVALGSFLDSTEYHASGNSVLGENNAST
ncbi:MAG: hypothetical protein KKB31_04905 [Nanoarchaeota archaeon]|nr:hypothetical protein [Nanoarchaeota archaeon]